MSNNSDVKLIFFDLGCVLVDVHYQWFLRQITRLTGRDVENHFEKRHQKSIAAIVSFNRGELDPETFYRMFMRGIEDVSFEQFSDAYVRMFSLKKDVSDIVYSLADHVRLSVISNTDEMHFGYICDSYPVMELFESPTTSFAARALKPENEIYEYALRQVGMQPAQCLFIDDKIENIQGAEAIGMSAIHFTKADALKKRLVEFGFSILTD